jgi:hypothetical protein
MQVVFNNVNRDGTPVANPDPGLLADENAVRAILQSMFFNNITLTFNVGIGFNPGTGAIVGPGAAAAGPNANKYVFRTYAQVRTALLNSGQPNFFTDANLPPGNSITPTPGQPGTISNFFISSSQAKALGLGAIILIHPH